MIMLLLVATCVILLYHYTSRNHDYWAKRNVKHDRPLPFFGNHLKNFLVRRTVPEIGIELYNKYKGEKIVGYYRGRTPELIIRDPLIMKQIMTAGFKNFPDRGRRKLRDMFPVLSQSIECLNSRIESLISHGEMDAYDLTVGYTVRFLASCCFNVKLNNNSPERSSLAVLSKTFFTKTKLQTLIITLLEIFPEISKLFTYKFVNKDLEAKVIEITRKMLEERILKSMRSSDLLDILLETETRTQNDMTVEGNQKRQAEKKIEEEKLYCIASQLMLVFVGGFETTATAMSYTLHQLARHPEIQLKVQQEIDRVLLQYDNNLTYECLDQLPLLEMAFKESMRFMAPVGALRRTCAIKYTIPGTDVTIDPGVIIFIPIQAMHMDPEYFKHPEEFRPDRFTSEAGKQFPNSKYLIFGEGPRRCAGIRLALTMGLAGLAGILRRFTVVPATSSKTRLSVKKTSYLVQIIDGSVPIKFIPRK